MLSEELGFQEFLEDRQGRPDIPKRYSIKITVNIDVYNP